MGRGSFTTLGAWKEDPKSHSRFGDKPKAQIAFQGMQPPRGPRGTPKAPASSERLPRDANWLCFHPLSSELIGRPL